MRQVTTILGELLKIFPRYEFEKLEQQHQRNHYTKYYTGWQQLSRYSMHRLPVMTACETFKPALVSMSRNGTTSA